MKIPGTPPRPLPDRRLHLLIESIGLKVWNPTENVHVLH